MKSFVGQYLQSQSSQIKEIAKSYGKNPFLLPFIIFGNNLKTVVLTWAFSITIIVPILIVGFNGGLVGFILPLALKINPSYPTIVLFYLLVPHGSIEIPAITLVASSFILMVKKGPAGMYKRSLGLLFLSIILLAVAAVIESFITRTLASLVYSILY
ncbi:MAG: stage II sporulation protein M [Caldisphaeraceae archaeon]|nr:stage II sporulation protein M [Caldisphaeraceae archaeon]